MDPFQTPVLAAATPPGSPHGLRFQSSGKSPQSLMGSPYSMSSGRSPGMRSPQMQCSDLRSPQSRSPHCFRPDEPDPETSMPRLVIHKLVLINYKSYAGRQEVGPFNENFTAVVGPNGSGKSNVIDSLLFVFGFRAKKMRQDKLAGLIHESEEHPALPFARVEVHFETVGVPGSELVLAREVRRDGSNFYSLNNKKRSYAEVSVLLEERGIDLLHKRFLILQGEVESIALMPAKAEKDGDDGLLEYLEDIIGTSNYKTRIEELEKEFETLRSDCNEKQRRVDIVHKDLQKLDAERAEIEKFMLNQNRGIIARSHLWQLYTFRIETAISLLEKEMQEQQQDLLSLAEEKTRKREVLQNFDSQISQNVEEANNTKQQLKDATKKLKEAQLKQVKAKQRQDQIQARQKKAERNLAHAKNEHKSAQIWLENFSKDSQVLNRRLKEILRSEIDERKKLEDIQAELHESTKDLHDELEALQIQAEPWREKISVKQQQLDKLRNEEIESKKRIEEAQSLESECRAEAENIILQGHAAQKQVKMLTKHQDDLIKEQSAIQKEIAEATRDNDSVAQALNQLRPEVNAAQETKASSQNRNRLESELMRMKIPGLYGRLGSLGSIDEKYDIAISTAGPELNNFVVDTVETAKTCIEELRKRSIGRAKFMVLSKLRPISQSDTKYPATRLIDLVKPVDRLFMKAFASILGDTLVVGTPELATQVAFAGPRRYKVVTLGGMVVNSSGQMGGGGTPSRGLMAKFVVGVSSEELEDLEKRLASLELDYAEAKERLHELQTRNEEIETEIPRAVTELEKEKMSLKELEAQMISVREKRRKLQAELKFAEDNEAIAVASREFERENIQRDKTELEQRSSPIEGAIKKIQGQILEAGGIQLREQSVRVSDLQKEEAEIQKRIEEGQQKVAQESSKASHFEAEILRYQKEVDECACIDVTQDEVVDIHELETEFQRLSVNYTTQLNGIEDAKTQAQSTRLELERLRAAEIEAKNSWENLRHNMKVNHAKKIDVHNKLQGLKLHDVSMARGLEEPSSEPYIKRELDDSAGEEMAASQMPFEENDDEEDIEMIDEVEVEESRETGLRPQPYYGELTELSPDELDGLNEAELKHEINKSDEASKGGKLDTDTLERYRSRHSEYIDRKKVSDEAVAAYERVKDEVQRLKKRRYTEFMDGFLQISAKLKEMYQLITMGGNAELELVDTMEPFAEGILFSVMPPKKSWRNIANLSGGEKTLSSLALVFALHHYKPTPLYVMDEIDAALDFRNVSIIANYIKERTKNGQFIVISLRNNMFELASRLVGVYKVNNMTRSVTLQTD